MALIEPAQRCTQTACKNDVARRFSGAASQYDLLANVQAGIAQVALARIGKKSVARALDIGCGTGRHTYTLSQMSQQTTGLDLAPGMVAQAQRHYPQLQFLQGDAEQLPWQPNTFELVFSSMALQWCRQPSTAMTQMFSVLNSTGYAELAIMVEGSFPELRQASQNGNIALQINPLFEVGDWLAATQYAGFHCQAVALANYEDHFNDLLSLLRSIKRIGAGSPASMTGKQGLTRKHLKRLELTMPRNEQGCLINTYRVLHLSLEKAQ